MHVLLSVSQRRRALPPLLLALALAVALLPVSRRSLAASTNVVISQVYGGGGNTYLNDYVELYNLGSAAVNLTGWSIQYASATGTGNFSNNGAVALSGSIQPGQHYLVQMAAGSGGAALPTPDATGTLNLSASGGKVILANTTTGLDCNGGTTACSAAQLAQIIDLVGYGAANFFEGGGAAPAPSSTSAILRAGSGATDTDDNASDFTADAPNPRNSSAGTPAAPSVSTQPQSQTIISGATASLTVAAGGIAPLSYQWYRGASGDTSTPVGSDSASFTTPALTSTTSYWVRVSNSQGSADSDTAIVSVSSTPPAACGDPATKISAIQGNTDTTAITSPVTIQGVVVGDYEGASPALRGFYVEEEIADQDGDPATSEGIFVFNGSNDSVSLGDVVRVSGTPAENQGQTQIGNITAITHCATGATLAPVDVSLPFPTESGGVAYLERYEGMLVRFPQTLYVTELYQLGRFGQVTLSAGGRLPQPTDEAAPGAPALAVQAANTLNQIIVDDALNNQNPDPIRFARGGQPLSASNTLRGGDTVDHLTGVLSYTWAGNSASGNAYRLRPIDALGGGAPDFQPANPRPAEPPVVGGSIAVASLNTLNFFVSLDTGTPACGPAKDQDCRGANSGAEFTRQRDKLLATLSALDADIYGLNELENTSGVEPLQSIVEGLNATAGAGTYSFIDTGTIGSDAIKVGIIYNTKTVSPTAAFKVLDSSVDARFLDTKNRPSLAQTFTQISNGEKLTVVVNHLKSKGSACDDVSDPDANDGQGNCNGTRAAATEALMDWIATDPTGSGDPDYLLVGDLNSYAMEDPVRAITVGADDAAGTDDDYTNLIATQIGTDAYSYVFDGQWGYLDYALASPELTAQVSGVAEWHINADEPGVLDYNTDFKSAGQVSDLYAADPYRTSDHDPVLVGLRLGGFTIYLPEVYR